MWLFSKRMEVRFGMEPSSGGIVPVSCTHTRTCTSVMGQWRQAYSHSERIFNFAMYCSNSAVNAACACLSHYKARQSFTLSMHPVERQRKTETALRGCAGVAIGFARPYEKGSSVCMQCCFGSATFTPELNDLSCKCPKLQARLPIELLLPMQV